MTNSVFSGLQPSMVWRHFATLCAIPRASKHEGALRSVILQWATAQGLDASIDAAGNPDRPEAGTPGDVRVFRVSCCRAHLDMVCQKNSDSARDFSRRSYRPGMSRWLAGGRQDDAGRG